MFPNSVKSHKQTSSKEFVKLLKVAKVEKVIIHRSLGLKAQDHKILKQSIEEFRSITGQQPVITRSKKSIAAFKIRTGMPIGLKVTLRGSKMNAFLDRLIHLVLPQVKDFQGLKVNQFDMQGNYHLGLTDQSVFPEIQTNFNDTKLGLDLSLVTNLKTKEEAEQFLIKLGFPFRKTW